jgi:NitT/TauT family transport system ATP-binding protein
MSSSSGPPLLAAEQIGKRFRLPRGEPLSVLQNVDFAIDQGEFACIVGPSGCGKSTLLQIMAGLLAPSDGQARLAGRTISKPPAQMVVLFQQYNRSLLAWRTVERNVLFALENLPGVSPAERQQRVKGYLNRVGLTGFEHYYPFQLSGGMQQRVTIARALARHSEILLLDEPFSSLDALTRQELQDLLLTLWREERKTVLFVTHDIEEAVYLSSKVLVLSSRPARIIETLPNPLPYPRNQLTTREDERFLALRRQIYQLISPQIAGAQSVQTPSPVGTAHDHV